MEFLVGLVLGALHGQYGNLQQTNDDPLSKCLSESTEICSCFLSTIIIPRSHFVRFQYYLTVTVLCKNYCFTLACEGSVIFCNTRLMLENKRVYDI